MVKKISVFREHDAKYFKDYLTELIREVMISEGEWDGKGTDLEQAIVDVWNGTKPTYFSSFAALAVPDLKERVGLSGQAQKLESGALSEFWRSAGGKDTTSKADIKLGDKRVSMKMGPSAMLFGFGPGDARATMAAAILRSPVPETTEASELKELLGSLERAIGRAPLSVLKKAQRSAGQLPDDADEALKQVGGKAYQMDKDARAQMSQRLSQKAGIDPIAAQKMDMLAITSTRDLLSHAEEILKLEERLQNIEAEVVKALDPTTNPELEFAFYREALTAEVKFGGINMETGEVLDAGVENIADSMYLTQDKKTLAKHVAEGTPVERLHKFVILDEAYIKKIASAASWRGKFRSDSLKEKLATGEKKTGYNLFRASIIAEIKNTREKKNEYLQEFEGMLSGAVNEGLLTEQQLIEAGFKDFVNKLASHGKKLIQKGAEAWSSFIDKLSNLTKRLTAWFKDSILSIVEKIKGFLISIKEAIAGGTRGLMKFFGIELGEYLDLIEVDAISPQAGIILS
jgi:hypothetical protein